MPYNKTRDDDDKGHRTEQDRTGQDRTGQERRGEERRGEERRGEERRGQKGKRNTHVNHPPNPKTETCSPEFPTRRYSMPVLLGSSHAIVDMCVATPPSIPAHKQVPAIAPLRKPRASGTFPAPIFSSFLANFRAGRETGGHFAACLWEQKHGIQ
jgi:hypothetical protein